MTPFTIAFGKSGEPNPTDLIAGKHFRFDIDQYEPFFAAQVPEAMIDLLRIASAVYFVDRLVKRKRRDQQRFWSRSLNLRVAVLEPDRWNSHEIRDALNEAVQFLTDDTWEFSFKKDDQRTRRDAQRLHFSQPGEARVCLYSGGLDSAAGLGNQIARNSQRPVIPVTVWHQPIQRKLIQQQYALLKSKFGSTISPLIIKAAMIWTEDVKHLKEETSQRSRAFMFTVAGAAAAAMEGVSTVEVFESGIGAINLPLMSGMVGSRTTRSTHPEFLRKMSQLVSLILNEPITFDLPFEDHTKGQVVKELADHQLVELAKKTVSCVHYPLRDSKHKQCGVCPACIFRRQAMAVAGVAENQDAYKFDLFDSPIKANRVSQKRLKYFKAFLDQVVQLDKVEPLQPLPSRIRRHVYGTDILKVDQSTEPIIRLLSRYRDEWREIAARAAANGFSWTKLVGSTNTREEGASRVSA